MKAVYYEQFQAPLKIGNLKDPTPSSDSVVIEVKANGICRSDWHGWMGHDPDIQSFPHVPGHELAGVVAETGKDVNHWKVGDRVAIPFIAACGVCEQCQTGNQQVCPSQLQPGFTHWGAFAQYTCIHYADTNLVALPEEIDFTTAASLCCRFITSFRAIVDQAQVSAGQWVAIHACGGIGLSAIMIANALGTNVVAIDIDEVKLDIAKSLGAVAVVNGKDKSPQEVVEAVREITSGGAHVSVDALGHPTTCYNSVANLRRRGKHIQVGVIADDGGTTKLPLGRIMSWELEIIGSHGMQAHRFPEMLGMIKAGKLQPQRLVQKTISLEESIDVLMGMDKFDGVGITVIDQF